MMGYIMFVSRSYIVNLFSRCSYHLLQNLKFTTLLLLCSLFLSSCDGLFSDDEATPDSVVSSIVDKVTSMTSSATKKVEEIKDTLVVPVPAPEQNISGSYSSKMLNLQILQKTNKKVSYFNVRFNDGGQCSGELSGYLTMTEMNRGEYFEKQGCTLRFVFNDENIQLSEEGEDCSRHHSQQCTFSAIYQKDSLGVAEATPTASSGSITGSYSSKRTSTDGKECYGWEILVEGDNTAPTAMVSLFNGACDRPPQVAQNLQFDASRATLNFDIPSKSSTQAHFTGFFKDDVLHGSFNP